jgi:drug/metabolite transporter (DMT)-like permease
VPPRSSVHLSLVVVVTLWALNVTAVRYVVTHGVSPLAYSTIRYAAAALLFGLVTLWLERSLRFARRDVPLVLLSSLLLLVNQLAVVFALRDGTATTISLLLAATPFFAAAAGRAFGADALHGRFWLGALVSFAGVGLVAAGSRGHLEAGPLAIGLGLLTAATWGAYSASVAPLMRRYSPYRISTVVLAVGGLGVAVVGIGPTLEQDLDVGWSVWGTIAFAIVAALFLTNVLWFRAVHRIGAARATLAGNIQPFLGAVFALVLLSEPLTAVQVAGGALIGAGILLARRRATLEPQAD